MAIYGTVLYTVFVLSLNYARRLYNDNSALTPTLKTLHCATLTASQAAGVFLRMSQPSIACIDFWSRDCARAASSSSAN